MKYASVLLAVICSLSAVHAQWLETGVRPVASARSCSSARYVSLEYRVNCSPENIPARSTSWFDVDEFVVDTGISSTPAPGSQVSQRVAFDGTNFLVVWGDNRGGSGDVYGARVTSQGTVLDPAGFVVSQAVGDQGGPAVSFDGACFLVVWQDNRNDSECIYGTRVTPQGTVLDPAGLVISQAPGGRGGLAVSFDGANYLVVWHDTRGGSFDIYGARVTSQGAVLDPEGIVISQATNDQGYPQLAFDGMNSLVVWGDLRNGNWDIYGARITTQGTVLDSGLVISQAAGAQRFPSVSFDGANYLVAWPAHSDIYGARVTPQGMVLDPAGIAIAQAPDDQEYAAVGFDGANFLVTWADYRSGWAHIYGARVTPAGVVLDPSGFAISQGSNCQIGPALAFDGANSLVVWNDQHISGEQWDLYGARVTPEGTVLDSAGIAMSTSANWQELPALAYDGANFLVAWQDRRNRSDWDIYGARVTPQGTTLDAASVTISAAANLQESPALAFGGADFLVVWQDLRTDTGDIYGARVTPQCTVLDPAGIIISAATSLQEAPALASDGTNFLVVWRDYRNDSHGDIYGARVSPTGVVLDPAGIVISQTTSRKYFPAVAFDGTNFLVAWHDSRGKSWDIYGARVTPAGEVLDPSGLAISRSEYEQYYPALAFDGANYLVIWEDNSISGYWDVCGARVTPQGTVLDTAGMVISQTASFWCSPVTLGFDGTDFLVACAVSWNPRGDDFDIHGARVTPGGTVLESGPMVLQQGNQWYPKLCRGDGSHMLLAYQGWAGAVNRRIYNTTRIWGKVNPNPGVEEVVQPRSAGPRRSATIVRSLPQGAVAFDAMGRRVKNPRSGIYFVRDEGRGAGDAGLTRKVVLQR